MKANTEQQREWLKDQIRERKDQLKQEKDEEKYAFYLILISFVIVLTRSRPWPSTVSEACSKMTWPSAVQTTSSRSSWRTNVSPRRNVEGRNSGFKNRRGWTRERSSGRAMSRLSSLCAGVLSLRLWLVAVAVLSQSDTWGAFYRKFYDHRLFINV